MTSKNKEFADVYENRCDLEQGLASNDASAEGHNMKMMKLYGFSNDLRSKCLKARWLLEHVYYFIGFKNFCAKRNAGHYTM